MTYEMPYKKEWEIEKLSPEKKNHLNKILDQKFTYLGKGAQSYVFSSEDGSYVIKFFKFKHLKPNILLKALPSIYPFTEYKEKEIARKDKKLNSVFNGYRLAYEIHKKQTGLIYIHLNKTTELNKTITVIDKIGRSFEIDLDQNVFLIQKKGETLISTLSKLLKNQDLDLAKLRIRQIFDLYVSEYKKGVYDHDKGVMNNTGFVGEKPIHLDVGKFMKQENMRKPSEYSLDLKRVREKIDSWLEKHFPDHHEEIAKDMEEKFLEVTL